MLWIKFKCHPLDEFELIKKTPLKSHTISTNLARQLFRAIFPLIKTRNENVFTWFSCKWIDLNQLFSFVSIVTAPAIRVIDEQDNEIHDRYYKIGSKIDLTCQVSTKFITKNATSKAKTQFSLLQRQTDIQLPPTPPPTRFPPISAFDIKDNEIDVSERATLRVAVNDSIFRQIQWTKDGETVSKDAVFNLR